MAWASTDAKIRTLALGTGDLFIVMAEDYLRSLKDKMFCSREIGL